MTSRWKLMTFGLDHVTRDFSVNWILDREQLDITPGDDVVDSQSIPLHSPHGVQAIVKSSE